MAGKARSTKKGAFWRNALFFKKNHPPPLKPHWTEVTGDTAFPRATKKSLSVELSSIVPFPSTAAFFFFLFLLLIFKKIELF